jgi:predicted phosphodiesterase
LLESAVDGVIVAGDVLPGPMSSASLDLLGTLDLPVWYLTGNGEREALRAVDGLELTGVPAPHRPPVHWSGKDLRPEQVAFVRNWPGTIEMDVKGLGRVLACHATPRSDVEIFTRLTPDDRIAAAFAGVAADLVVCGHTHMAFDRVIAGVRVVNAGSVGMPFGEPGAHWLLLDAEGVHFMHTRYDLNAAATRIRATTYPDAESFATSYVLNPPTEAAMLAAMSVADG